MTTFVTQTPNALAETEDAYMSSAGEPECRYFTAIPSADEKLWEVSCLVVTEGKSDVCLFVNGLTMRTRGY